MNIISTRSGLAISVDFKDIPIPVQEDIVCEIIRLWCNPTNKLNMDAQHALDNLQNYMAEIKR